MRREDAIKTLRELWRETNDSWYEEVYDMAIEALSAETKVRKMSILVKGMKMPRGCYECPLLDGEYGDCKAGATDFHDPYYPYFEDCPIEESKTGKWYIREYEYFTCSECGEDYWNSCDSTAEAEELLKTGDYPNYCPNCGANMRGENHDRDRV